MQTTGKTSPVQNVQGIEQMQLNNTRAPAHNTITSDALPIAASATKWLLLVCAATFGSIFAYNTLSPISTLLAAIVAIAVIGLNFAESYLVRFSVAAWRFGFGKLALVASVGALLISCYSIMAGYNVVESYLLKNQNSSLASDYDIAASKQRIQAAKEQSINSLDFENRQADFYSASAEENERIATLLRNKPINNSSVNPSTAATLIATALEVAIIGLCAFIELFIRPTPLPALVKFNDKLVNWNLDDSQLQNLQITTSPSAGTVGLPQHETAPAPVRTRGGDENVSVYVHANINEDHFQEWLTLVNQEQLKPTVTDAKKYLRTTHKYKMEDAQNDAGEYLERAYNLGYLDLNDNQGAFSSQYVLVSKKLIGGGV